MERSIDELESAGAASSDSSSQKASLKLQEDLLPDLNLKRPAPPSDFYPGPKPPFPLPTPTPRPRPPRPEDFLPEPSDPEHKDPLQKFLDELKKELEKEKEEKTKIPPGKGKITDEKKS